MDKRKKESLEVLWNLEKYRTSLRTLPDFISSYEIEYRMKESEWDESQKAVAKERIQWYKQWLNYTKVRVEAIECALAALSDEQQTILRYMCVERREDSVVMLCNMLWRGRSSLYMKYKEALQDFESCLFGARMDLEG